MGGVGSEASQPCLQTDGLKDRLSPEAGPWVGHPALWPSLCWPVVPQRLSLSLEIWLSGPLLGAVHCCGVTPVPEVLPTQPILTGLGASLGARLVSFC